MTRGPASFRQLSGETVEQLAERRATGALHNEAGTVHLADGWVVNVESAQAPGVAGLLTACGRIAPEVWQEAVHAFGPACRVGPALVDQGRLTRGELELCHLGALYDAAYFVLPARSTTTWFEPGARHWLGQVRRVNAHRLRQETLRRRGLLERIWPCPQVDTAPVVRARPGRGGRPVSARQRELLDHADGSRTPLDLARILGRSAFATTADIRRLAAAGLVATPPVAVVRTPEVTARPAAGRVRPATGAPSAIGARPADRAPTAADVEADTMELTLAGLERRIPGAALAAVPGGAAAAHRRSEPPSPRRPTHAAAHPLSVPDPDIALLIRVRTALEARL